MKHRRFDDASFAKSSRGGSCSILGESCSIWERAAASGLAGAPRPAGRPGAKSTSSNCRCCMWPCHAKILRAKLLLNWGGRGGDPPLPQTPSAPRIFGSRGRTRHRLKVDASFAIIKTRSPVGLLWVICRSPVGPEKQFRRHSGFDLESLLSFFDKSLY